MLLAASLAANRISVNIFTHVCRLVVFCFCMLLLVIFQLTPATATQVEASRSGLPWPSGVFTSSATSTALEAWRGRAFDVETLFFGTTTWTHMIASAGVLKKKLPGLPSRLIVALGMLPLDHWGQLEACAAGRFDPFIHALTAAMLNHGAAAAAAAGRPILIRLGWEANAVDSNYPWGVTGDGTSWRACFRRWVDILNPITNSATSPPSRQKNFLIVWNMANRGTFKHPIDNMWPGDDYVDIVASQYYDRCPPLVDGDEIEWQRRLSARDAQGNPAGPLSWLNYARLKGKPYAIPEWGVGGPRDICGRPGIDGPYFIKKMYDFFQLIAPDLAFESYFNGHGFIDDSKGSHKLFALEPSFPDPDSPHYLTYVHRYNPKAAQMYRALWGQDLAQVSPEISITPLAAAVAEGQDGLTGFTFTVSRTGNPGQAVGVSWQVAPSGGADAGDFAGGILPSGTLSLAPGETSKTVTVSVRGDLKEEADESFELVLANPTGGASLATATAAALILNDDLEPPTLAVTAVSASKAEGQQGSTAFTFAVTRTGSTRQAIRVDWKALGSGKYPAAATDFSGGRFPSGTLRFAVGETRKLITVPVAGDRHRESPESFSVALFNPSPGTKLRTAVTKGNILNDDR
jgi:hypothetical protein